MSNTAVLVVSFDPEVIEPYDLLRQMGDLPEGAIAWTAIEGPAARVQETVRQEWLGETRATLDYINGDDEPADSPDHARQGDQP